MRRRPRVERGYRGWGGLSNGTHVPFDNLSQVCGYTSFIYDFV